MRLHNTDDGPPAVPGRWCSSRATGIAQRWTVNGHYTLQLQNDGNYEGEDEPAG